MTCCLITLEFDTPAKASYEIDKEALVIVNEGICVEGKAEEEIKCEDTLEE
jgi:hypothetical protein